MWGLDLLGLRQYPRVGAANFPGGFGLGVFSSTFGDSRKAVSRILEKGDCPAVRVHLAWSDTHTFRPSQFGEIGREARSWIPIINRFGNVKWYFSGACEHRMTEKDAKSLAEAVLSVLPSGCKYVNTPIDVGASISGPRILNERHGADARPRDGKEIFSFDGSACVDSNVTEIKKRFKDAEIFFFWEPRFNGRWEVTDKTLRPNRTGWPDAKLIKSVALLAGEMEGASLPEKWLYKSHAENHGKGDSKAEKAMFICPERTSSIDLFISGTRIKLNSLRYYGPFSGGGFRYYSSKWGFEIGTELVDVRIGDRLVGRINPVFRFGNFR